MLVVPVPSLCECLRDIHPPRCIIPSFTFLHPPSPSFSILHPLPRISLPFLFLFLSPLSLHLSSPCLTSPTLHSTLLPPSLSFSLHPYLSSIDPHRLSSFSLPSSFPPLHHLITHLPFSHSLLIDDSSIPILVQQVLHSPSHLPSPLTPFYSSNQHNLTLLIPSLSPQWELGHHNAYLSLCSIGGLSVPLPFLHPLLPPAFLFNAYGPFMFSMRRGDGVKVHLLLTSLPRLTLRHLSQVNLNSLLPLVQPAPFSLSLFSLPPPFG